ncbi:MAG TPA: glycosyl hydrolase 115 family protein [Opitutaceae bacterium]|nr:glycosyl hydrolase 115 family protein [Opitutaceae bacterium]
MKFFIPILAVFLTMGVSGAESPLLTPTPGAQDFTLAAQGRAVPVLTETKADQAVARAAADLRTDIARVSGVAPASVDERSPLPREFIIAGVAGQSALLDQMAAAGKIDLSGLSGAWESFVIQVVNAPLPGVDRALVIAGSDRRGAIFGIYEVSQAIGVSPWHWWADVAPARKDTLAIAAGPRRFGPPSVKYRGIFINDEDWALQPWAARTHEPENGDIGPKTYARVFELLLRLKANLLWPGMHPSTKPFNGFAENKVLADRYGIVMGSSHAEPMLRNNVGEWKAPAAEYNFIANRDGVIAYWEERMRQNGAYENVYTMGMRGIHDSNMVGPRTDEERIAALERIFAEQRTLLKKYARGGEAAPQMFCAYKEVLELYRKGLKVPDDVTIVWPDDNFGYVRNFATSEERKRSGGFGVYYHVSYLGAPMAYLWLNSTPPGLIWEEMNKSYEQGADRMWIVNVGDIKPAEIATEFFLQMAWDIRRWNAGNLDDFLPAWATREFGPAAAGKIAAIQAEYYRLNFVRKPEHLQWWLPGQRTAESPLTPAQAAARLADFRRIVAQTLAVEQEIPAADRDAFFQLVKYPVLGASAANERYFHAEAYGRLFNYDLESARQHAHLARMADQTLTQLTQHFNEGVAGGKWRYFMSLEPADNQWRSFRISPAAVPAASMAAISADLSNLKYGRTPARPVATPARIDLDPVKFTANHAAGGASWTRLGGIARTGGMITVLPTTIPSVDPAQKDASAPVVEYAVELPATGSYRVVLGTLPTHPLTRGGNNSRLAVSLGAAPAQVLPVGTRDGAPEWAQGVLNNTTPASATFADQAAGLSRLRIQMVDPGVVVESIFIEPVEAAPAPGKSSP